jgi:hypothetical protein
MHDIVDNLVSICFTSLEQKAVDRIFCRACSNHLTTNKEEKKSSPVYITYIISNIFHKLYVYYYNFGL